jgi:hypothetical protein
MVELNQICGPGGATARVPHGASDEVIEEALTWVLKNRIQYYAARPLVRSARQGQGVSWSDLTDGISFSGRVSSL